MNFASENRFTIKKLKNGLTIKLIEKPNFKVFNVQLIVHFGSSNIKFRNNSIPAGTAHLMEHLLFHKKDYEIDSLFSQLGINVNAYTTYNSTDFFYTCLKRDRNYFQRSLEFLFDLVCNPYFSSEIIFKEISIIESEMKITDDDSEAQLYSKLLAQLYPGTPLETDILGTTQSLKQISSKLLQEVYDSFYQPENMVLYVCGPITMEQLLDCVEKFNLIESPKNKSDIDQYYFKKVPNILNFPHHKLVKLFYGWSLPQQYLSYQEALSFSLYLENMLGKRSYFFHKMYNQGIINDDFYYDFVVEKNFTLIYFSCLTELPKEVIYNTEMTLLSHLVSTEKFAITIKNFIGKYIQSFDSINEIAAWENDGKYNLEDAISSLDFVKKLRVDQVKETATKVFSDYQLGYTWKLIS
ncbi:MAG: insulinase family protein [Bombilactobacillus mellifer]|nr:insulinase family protein [Bombilactobacillus mellifer]